MDVRSTRGNGHPATAVPASAVLYAGEGVVPSYLEDGILTADEVAEGLSRFLRFRWAVQADYFARRLVTDDRTGIADPAERNASYDLLQQRLGFVAISCSHAGFHHRGLRGTGRHRVERYAAARELPRQCLRKCDHPSLAR